MEKKTDALVLKSTDYRESDRIVTLLTAEYGKLGAAVKGVKKAGAKLRFAAQPFCFAEYVLVQKSDRHTVVSASLHNSFFSLSEDLGAYYTGCAILEVCDKLTYENMDARKLLVLAVSSLKELEEGREAERLARFLISALDFAGYPVRAEKCPFCGRELKGRMRFDLDGGAFACSECGKGVPASESTYLAVRALLRGEEIPSRDGCIRALRLLKTFLSKHTELDFPALQEAISIIEE